MAFVGDRWNIALRAAVSKANSQSESVHIVQCGMVETTPHQRFVHDGHGSPFGMTFGSFGALAKGWSTTSVQSCVGLLRLTACPSGFAFRPGTGTGMHRPPRFRIHTDSEA